MKQLSLELATYNITFKQIFGRYNKAADCLSWLVEVTENNAAATINLITASPADRPTTHTRSKPKKSTEAIPPDITKVNAPLAHTEDCKDTLLQMQRTDSFYKCISKQLSNRKAPHHELHMFTHINGLPYKHAMNAPQIFLALAIPKVWHFTYSLRHTLS